MQKSIKNYIKHLLCKYTPKQHSIKVATFLESIALW